MMNPAEFAHIARAERDLWWYRGQRRILFRLLDPLLQGRTIRTALEGGCGTGYFAQVLAERYGWQVTALDLGFEGLEYGHSLGVPRLVQGDLAALPFPPAAFDAVVSMDVIVHFPRGTEMRAFAELARVLRPGGLLIVRVSALDALRSRHSLHAHERQRFTRHRLRQQVEEQGLRVLRATYVNSLLLPVAFAKFRLWEPLTNAPAASGVDPVAPWLDGLLHAPLALESAVVGAGVNLPLGQSLVLVAEKP